MQVTIQDLMAVMKQLEDVSHCSAQIVEDDSLPTSQRTYYSGIMFGVEDARERLLSLIVKTMQSQDADHQEQC
ncbi:MAG: hypothetical protein RLP44_24200 [Aggregatilineales bacterium]